MNYRFSINISDKKFVNLACLANILVADDRIKDMAPFPIQYVKYDNDITKIAIVFTNKFGYMFGRNLKRLISLALKQSWQVL